MASQEYLSKRNNNLCPKQKIIIQAGGKGTRLEWLTRNKPKCLVPINNLPIIFYAFEKFPDTEFSIIADYKIEVLEKYLNVFGQKYNYKIIKAQRGGGHNIRYQGSHSIIF